MKKNKAKHLNLKTDTHKEMELQIRIHLNVLMWNVGNTYWALSKYCLKTFNFNADHALAYNVIRENVT